MLVENEQLTLSTIILERRSESRQNAEVEAEMEAFHSSFQCRGLQPSECDRHILQLAQQQSFYGIHRHNAKDSDGCHINLGISCKGLLVFRQDVLISTFKWFYVRKTFVEQEIFYVELLSNEQRVQVGFHMENKTEAKFFLRFFVDCQRFYTDSFSSQHLVSVKEMSQGFVLLESATPTTASRSYRGKFDLKSADPRCSCPIQLVSLRRRAVSADNCQSYLSPERESASIHTSFNSKNTFDDAVMFMQSADLEKDDESESTDSNDCAANEDSEDEGSSESGWTTPEDLEIPDVDIRQVVQTLSEETTSHPSNFITCELRDTERSYCADLQLLNVHFKLNLINSRILSLRQVSELFGNLGLIQEFSNDFLSELEERINICDSCPKRYNYKYQIGDILKKRMACMKLYTNYVKNESKIFELVSQWQRENSEFSRLCSRFGSDDAGNRPLSELFYRPFQRMIHYRELMKRLIPNLDVQHDCGDVKEALCHLENALDHVNKSTRAAESTRKMIRIQREVLDVGNVLQPHRTLIMEGTFMRVEMKTPQLTHFFLFSDILLYAVKRSGLNRVRLVARGVLPLARMRVDESEGGSSTASFIIRTDTTSFTVIAETTRQKDLWITSLRDAITQCNSSANSQSSVVHDGSDSDLGGLFATKTLSTVKQCMSCGSKFHIFRKRKQCEQCFKVVCQSCLDALSDEFCDGAKHVCIKCSTEAKRLKSLRALRRTTARSIRSPQPTAKSNRSLRSKQLNLSKLSSDFVLTRKTHAIEMPVQQTQIISNEIEKDDSSSSSLSHLLLSLKSSSFSGDSEMSGYLFRKTAGKDGWKQFWVVASPFSLRHYKNHDDSVLVSSLVPINYKLAYPDGDDIEAVGCMYVFKLSCGPRVLFYMTESKFALDRWTEVLSLSVKRSLVHRQLGHLSRSTARRLNGRLPSNSVC